MRLRALSAAALAALALSGCGRDGYGKRELGGGSWEITNPDGVFRYRSPKQAKESGIGIRIAKDPDGRQKIVELFTASPAAMAGLKTGDLVLEVDGHPLKGLEVEQAANFIRGVPGTLLTVQYERNGKAAALRIGRAKDAMIFDQYPPGIEVRNLPASGFPGASCPPETEKACHFLLQSGDNCYYSCPLGAR